MKIFYGSNPKYNEKDKSMFSRGKFECKLLLQKRNGDPVAVSQSKDKDYPVWKVEHGFSCMVFATFDEAMAYCKGRYFDLDGKVV